MLQIHKQHKYRKVLLLSDKFKAYQPPVSKPTYICNVVKVLSDVLKFFKT